MKNKLALEEHFCLWMTDTCNRYFHVLDDLGIINRKKAEKLSNKILEKRNEMLDKYIPYFVETTFHLLEVEKEKKD